MSSGVEKINYSVNTEPHIEGEIWKDIVGYEGLYQVSNYGRVRSLDRPVWNYKKPGRVLVQLDNGNCYRNVNLSKGGRKEKHVYVHKLVAQAFIPNPDNLPQVNHKDFDKSNNTVENLEWVTDLQNKLHYRKSNRCRQIERKRKEKLQSKTLQRVKDYKAQIISMYQSGYSEDEIGRALGVGHDFVGDVLSLFDIR